MQFITQAIVRLLHLSWLLKLFIMIRSLDWSPEPLMAAIYHILADSLMTMSLFMIAGDTILLKSDNVAVSQKHLNNYL